MLGWKVFLAVSSLEGNRGGMKNLVLLPQVPSHVISEPCSELRNLWRCFSGVFPCSLPPDLCWELWSSTLGPSGATPWETVAVTFTLISVWLNLLHKCVTPQWDVTCTVVYVPQAKMSNPHPYNTGNHETKREEGRKYMWHRMTLRMKPRWKKKNVLLCFYGAVGAQNSLGKLCCLCLCGKSCKLSPLYYSHAWTVLCAFGLLPDGRDRKTQTYEEHSLSLQTLCYRTWCLGIEKQEIQSISVLIYSI